MNTQLVLERGLVEGRAHRWQEMTSLRTSGLSLSERRKSRAREDRKH